MKSFFTLFASLSLCLASALSFARPMPDALPFISDAKECANWVALHGSMFSICGDGSVDAKEVTCAKQSNSWVCEFYHEPWPSSDCQVRVTLDHECYRNTKAELIRDNREDL